MASIDDIWADMNDDYQRALPLKPSKKSSSSTGKTGNSSTKAVESSVAAILAGVEKVNIKTDSKSSVEAKKVVKKKVSKPVAQTAEDERPKETETEKQAKETVSYAELLGKISKHIHALSDDDVSTRKRALLALHKALLVEYTLSPEREYNALFHELCKPLFKRYGDSVEKCRELAHTLTHFFFSRCQDLVPVLGYYFPALLQRLPKDIGYDEELKVFVLDKELHLAYKRGKAVDRQDKLGEASLTHVEPSEEIRFASLQGLATLIHRVKALDSLPILHPYFEDIMIALQVSLNDANPETKLLSCDALETMARIADFELGFKYYSVALIRVLLPQLKHRQFKVRAAALSAIHAVMVVPDRAKRKASGSEAIADLVGFREENVLPIAAFYKPDVSYNYLAELVTDKSSVVRERLAVFLTALLTEIDDRYDHQTRLLPYVLDLLTDEIPSIAHSALQCLQRCGKEYEEEHFEEILQKKQYNVDGDDRVNLEKPLPAPFTESGRPSIGMRLYVRGNTKRFLHALVNELTNWVAHTRLKSANLMKMVIVLCEEHLTMEVHALLPALIKALKFAREDEDPQLQHMLLEVYELLGRYLLPEIYLFYILPRLRGDADVVAFGLDNETRITVLLFLQSLLSGSKATQILPHFETLIDTLTNEMLLNFVDSLKLSTAVLEILEILVVSTMSGRGQHVMEAFYLNSGRLSTLQVTIRKLFRYLLSVLCVHPSLQEKAIRVLCVLSGVESAQRAVESTTMKNDLARLFYTQSSFLWRDLLSPHCGSGAYDVDFFRTARLHTTSSLAIESVSHTQGHSNGGVAASEDCAMMEHQLLAHLLLAPWHGVHCQPALLDEFFVFSKRTLTQDVQELNGIADCENELFLAISRLFLSLAMPVYLREFAVAAQHGEFFHHLLDASQDGEEKTEKAKQKKTNKRVVAGMPHGAERLQALRVVNTHCETALELFVLNHHWGRSVALSAQRLQVLALLCGHLPQVRALLQQSNNLAEHSDAEESEGDGEDEEQDEDDEETPFPLTANAALLARYLPSVVSAVLPSCLSPSAPRALRRTAVSLFHAIVKDLKRLTKLERLRAFAKSEQDGEGEMDSVAWYAKLATQSLIRSLLNAIQDSDDEVRGEILRTLTACVPLFVSEEMVSKRKSETAIDAVVSLRVATQTVFRELLVELQLSTISPLVHEIDLTLRSLCVLDPVLFESIVREEFESSGCAAGNERKAEFVNDLINHADLLRSMPR